MNKEYEPKETSINIIKEKIFSGNCHIFFDIDGTIKGPISAETPLGFDQQLPSLLGKLSKIPGLSVGACTSQSPPELYSFLQKMDPPVGGQLMSGLSILEDGHLLVNNGQNMLNGYTEFILPDAKKQIALLKNAIKKVWIPAKESYLEKNGWGYLPGVTTPVALASGKYQGIVTLSLWEWGPDIHDSDYHGEYEPIAAFVTGLAEELNTDLIEIKEAGNGTLRVVQKGLSKETALTALAAQGIVDLKNTVYVGDGLNDVAPAGVVNKSGGAVIAVANAIPELKKKAIYVSQKTESHGVVEVLSSIFSN